MVHNQILSIIIILIYTPILNESTVDSGFISSGEINSLNVL